LYVQKTYVTSEVTDIEAQSDILLDKKDENTDVLSSQILKIKVISLLKITRVLIILFVLGLLECQPDCFCPSAD
jgi:hypothetical protein